MPSRSDVIPPTSEFRVRLSVMLYPTLSHGEGTKTVSLSSEWSRVVVVVGRSEEARVPVVDGDADATVARGNADDVVALAPDFTLYGLDESWVGARWIAGMSGPGGPVATFGLSHVDADYSRGVTVRTIDRRRYDSWRSDARRGPEDAVAEEAVDDLLATTWPAPDIMDAADWLDEVAEYAAARARDRQSWAQVSWRVDGVPVAAACWRFAGAWTGLTTEVPGAYVVITAVNVDPAIGLRSLADAAPYGFQLGADITIAQMAIGGPLPNPNSEGFHADHHAARRPSPSL